VYNIEDIVKVLYKDIKLEAKWVDKVGNMIEFLCLASGISEKKIQNAWESAIREW